MIRLAQDAAALEVEEMALVHGLSMRLRHVINIQISDFKDSILVNPILHAIRIVQVSEVISEYGSWVQIV